MFPMSHVPAARRADIRRDNRPELKKAGNLRYAFARTLGELYAIFDADFCPRPDFLRETVPYFEAEPSIGILQTPQFFRRREEQTWVEQGAGSGQELFYRLIQVRGRRETVCAAGGGANWVARWRGAGGMDDTHVRLHSISTQFTIDLAST